MNDFPNPFDPSQGTPWTAMTRPSEILAFGSGISPQYTLFEEFLAPLRYVIKRHRATRLHTDLRFELFGTLVSFASYPRPSLNPRRPISLREMGDHQLAHINGERRIPDGGYGAGPVLVWDFGSYHPLRNGRPAGEQAVLEDLQRGRLDFRMNGIRLKGDFRLEQDRKEWQLFKLEDAYSTTERFEWDDLSVISGKSLDQIEAEYQDQMRKLRG